MGVSDLKSLKKNNISESQTLDHKSIIDHTVHTVWPESYNLLCMTRTRRQ